MLRYERSQGPNGLGSYIAGLMNSDERENDDSGGNVAHPSDNSFKDVGSDLQAKPAVKGTIGDDQVDAMPAAEEKKIPKAVAKKSAQRKGKHTQKNTEANEDSAKSIDIPEQVHEHVPWIEQKLMEFR